MKNGGREVPESPGMKQKQGGTDMASTIFREKSLQRVSSPEELNDYIRVTNPGVWLTLSAVIILLAGFLVWGVVGSLETKVDAVALSDAGAAACYVKEAEISDVEAGDVVRIGGEEYTVEEISAEPVAVDDSFSAYAQRVGGLSVGEWVYPVTLSGALPEGVHEASIVTDSVSPISFLFN